MKHMHECRKAPPISSGEYKDFQQDDDYRSEKRKHLKASPVNSGEYKDLQQDDDYGSKKQKSLKAPPVSSGEYKDFQQDDDYGSKKQKSLKAPPVSSDEYKDFQQDDDYGSKKQKSLKALPVSSGEYKDFQQDDNYDSEKVKYNTHCEFSMPELSAARDVLRNRLQKPPVAFVIMKSALACFEESSIFSLERYSQKDVLLIYNPEKGYFHQYDCRKFATLLADIMSDTPFEPLFGSRTAREVFFLFLQCCDLQANLSDFDSDDRYLNVLNGVVDLDTGELLEHNKKFRFLSVLHCEYNAEYSQCNQLPSMFRTMLKRHFPDEADRKLFLECLAYLISGKHGLKVAPFWIGDAHTGKSTFERLLTEFLDEGVAHHSLVQISSKHGSADLEDISVNICSEVQRSVVKDMDRFKAIVGGDPISVEPKYQSLHSMKSRTKILLVGNDFMPLAKGLGEPALYDRIMPIKFRNPYTEEEMEPMFDDRLLKEEGDKIFAVIVRKLRELRRTGYKFTHSELSAREKRRFIQINSPMDSVECFTEDACKKVFGEFCRCADIYGAYQIYSRKNEFDVVSRGKFFREFPSKMGLKAVRRQINGKQYRGYEDIRILSDEI